MTPIAARMTDQWRSQYNPLRGLTIARAVALLEAGERGEYADLQWTYRMIEKRDGILRACKRRILSALVELEWEIKIPETVPDNQKGLAEKQYELLRERYDRIENLREAMKCLAAADFRGFAHLEKHFDSSGTVTRLEHVPQWHWVRDGLYGEWKFVADASSVSARGAGNAIDPEHFIIREVDDPIDEIALIAFIRKGLGQKDWDAFVESYGIPWFFLEMPQGIEPGTPEAQAYIDFAQQAMSDARGAVPAGAKPHSLQANAQQQPFDKYLKRQDNDIVLAATSSLLTVTTESGSGTLAGNAHQDTFEAVARAQALLISEIFNEQFDRPLLNGAFPGQPVYAYFELAAEDAEDTTAVVENVAKLKTAGIEMDIDDLAERTGYKLSRAAIPEDPSRQGQDEDSRQLELEKLENRQRGVKGLFNRIFNRAPAIEEVESASLDEAMREEYRSLYTEVDRIKQLPVSEQGPALAELRKELPEQLRTILTEGRSLEVIEEMIGEAVMEGVIESAKIGPEGPRKEKRLS